MVGRVSLKSVTEITWPERACKSRLIGGQHYIIIFTGKWKKIVVKVIEGGTLIDGTGRDPRQNVVIIAEGDKIKAVGKKVTFDTYHMLKLLALRIDIRYEMFH